MNAPVIILPSQPATPYTLNENRMHPERATWLNTSSHGIPPRKANLEAPQQNTHTRSITTGTELQSIQTLLSNLLKTLYTDKCREALDQSLDSFRICIKDAQAILCIAINIIPKTRVQQCPSLIDEIASAVTRIEQTLLAVNKKQIAIPPLFTRVPAMLPPSQPQ